MFKLVAEKEAAFAYLAHPVKTDFNYLFTKPRNDINDEAIVGIAVRTGPALGKNGNRTDYAASASGTFVTRYKELLQLGYHVAPGIDHDSHYTNFGMVTQRRLVILAKELSEVALMEALRARRFYASDDFNFKVDFTIGNAVMGEIFSASSTPELKYVTRDEDQEALDFVRLYYGESGSNEAPKFVNLGANETHSMPLMHFQVDKEFYYFLEIGQADGDKIYTAPIWFTAQGE